MTLTKLERWTLANQLKILEALYPAEAQELSYVREALESGYTYEYENCCSHIYDDVVSSDDCRFVRDVLSMYSALQMSYTRLGGAACGIPAHKVEFDGFDGNHETSHMAYAQFLVTKRRLWTNVQLGATGMNSHSPRLALYRGMLSRWSQLNQKVTLTLSELATVVQ